MDVGKLTKKGHFGGPKRGQKWPKMAKKVVIFEVSSKKRPERLFRKMPKMAKNGVQKTGFLTPKMGQKMGQKMGSFLDP